MVGNTLFRLTCAHPAIELTNAIADETEQAEAKFVQGPLGAAAAVKNDLTPGKSLVFTAHKDQIGLRLSYFEENGFARFVPVGGWDPQVLLSQRVVFPSKCGTPVFGVVGRKAIHLLKDGSEKTAVKLGNLWIDFGFKTAQEALEVFNVGTLGVIDSFPTVLHNQRLSARALDDLAGVAAILDMLKQVKDRKVVGLFTENEETIFMGTGWPWVPAFDPKHIIAVDVTFAEDPDTGAKDNQAIKMGKGPVVYHGGITDYALSRKIVAIASAAGIPYQEAVIGGHSSTDADGMATAGAGQSVALVSIPIRYMHSPCELVDLTDYENTIKLFVELQKQL